MQVPFKALLAFNEATSTPDHSWWHVRREWAEKWMHMDGWDPKNITQCLGMASDDLRAAKAEHVELLTWRKEMHRVKQALKDTKASLKYFKEGWAKACPPNKDLFPSSVGISNPIHVGQDIGV